MYRQFVYSTTETVDRGGITEPAGVPALSYITYILLLKLVTRGPLTETRCGPLYKGLEYAVAGNIQSSRIMDSPLCGGRCFGSAGGFVMRTEEKI